MKTVVLPDGRKAHFPDGVRPEIMGTTLLKLMETTQQAKDKATGRADELLKRSDEDRELRKSEMGERQQREDRQEGAHNERHQKTIMAMDKQTKATDGHTKATVAVAQGLNQGLDALVSAVKDNAKTAQMLGQKIDNLAKSAMEIKQLAKCVDDLQEQLKDSTEMIVKAMKSPRKIVHSTKGRPIGMQIGDE